MKKLLSLILAAVLVLSLTAVLSSCGDKADDKKDETTKAEETTAPEPEDTTEEETTAEEPEETTEEETTEASRITEGTVTILDLVSIEVKDGWYSEDGVDDTWNSIELVNDAVPGFLANVEVKVGRVYGDDHAKEWADNYNKNYGGGGTVTTETINGLTFYHLSGVVEDDNQNCYFADINDDYYLEVDIMFMSVEEGLPVFDLITVNK